MKKDQMELEIAATANSNSTHRQQQMKRAQWWFEQMRRVVDSAIEWEPNSDQRPQQQFFAMTLRQS